MTTIKYTIGRRSLNEDELNHLTTALQEEVIMSNPQQTTIGNILNEINETINQRGKERDLDEGERSMTKAVNAFNDLFGNAVTDRGYMEETEGWLFMLLLKLARHSSGNYNRDDLFDACAYTILALESKDTERPREG